MCKWNQVVAGMMAIVGSPLVKPHVCKGSQFESETAVGLEHFVTCRKWLNKTILANNIEKIAQQPQRT